MLSVKELKEQLNQFNDDLEVIIFFPDRGYWKPADEVIKDNLHSVAEKKPVLVIK